MNSIAFIDTEIEPKSRKILDIGSVRGDGNSFHSNSIADFIKFLNGTQFICGQLTGIRIPIRNSNIVAKPRRMQVFVLLLDPMDPKLRL